VAGEAAGGFRRDRAGGIVAAIGEAPLAPGVIGEALGDGAALVHQDRDGTEMVLDEVARLGRDRRAADRGLGEVLPHHLAARDEVLVPLAGAACADELLDFDAGDGIGVIEGAPHAVFLQDAHMGGVVGEGDRVGALRDRRHHVVGGPRHRARAVAGEVADRIIAVGGVVGAGDRGDRVRTRRAGGGVGVGPTYSVQR